MRNCASGNLEIPGSLVSLAPRNDVSDIGFKGGSTRCFISPRVGRYRLAPGSCVSSHKSGMPDKCQKRSVIRSPWPPRSSLSFGKTSPSQRVEQCVEIFLAAVG